MNVPWPNESDPKVPEYDPVEEQKQLDEADRIVLARRAEKTKAGAAARAEDDAKRDGTQGAPESP